MIALMVPRISVEDIGRLSPQLRAGGVSRDGGNSRDESRDPLTMDSGCVSQLWGKEHGFPVVSAVREVVGFVHLT